MLTSRCTLSHIRARVPLQSHPLSQSRGSLFATPLPRSLCPSPSPLTLPQKPLATTHAFRSSTLFDPCSLTLTQTLTPRFEHRRGLETIKAGSSPGAKDSKSDSKESQRTNPALPRGNSDESAKRTSDESAKRSSDESAKPRQQPPSTPAAPVLLFGSDGRLGLSNSKPEITLEEPPPAKPQSKSKTTSNAGKGGKTPSPNPKARGKPQPKSQPKPAPEEEVAWKKGAPLRREDKPKNKPTAAPKYSKAQRRFYNERFREDPCERLSKVLAAAGVASRRACEELIFAGRVTVNGETCLIPQTQVDLVKDNIYVDGRSLPRKLPPKLYFVVNKPKGYICSSTAESGKTAVSLIEEYMKVWRGRNPGMPSPRMFTVGRLDVATTGLLLITNDGGFAQRVAHPSSGVTKEYIATVSERVTRRQLAALETGVEVDGVMCSPVLVEVVEESSKSREGGARDRIRVVVAEGRNREVRRIVEGAGLSVVSLKRVRIGGMRLPKDLGIGKYKVLDALEAERLVGEPTLE